MRSLAIVGLGFLGHEVARRFGGPVVAATRSGQWRGDALANVELRRLDLLADALDPGPLRHTDALVIAVAAGRGQDRRRLYVEGVARLLAASTPATWRRVVFIGSTSALPDVDGWVDESCATRPDSDRGQVQCDAEQTVLSWCASSQVPGLIVRLGGLYGPGRDLGAIYRRRTDGPVPGHGHAPTNLIHRDDAVTATLAAVHAPAALTGVIHAVDDDHTPRRVMYARLAERTGREPVTWGEPAPPGLPIGKRVSNVALKQRLGVKLRHPAHVLPCAASPND